MKLNYGCGETKLEGFINIDIEDTTKPDMICDLRKQALPYETESVDKIHCLHNLEHIERKYWAQVIFEFARVLKPGAQLHLAYPEFEVCAKNYIENHQGLRDFWEKTIYGRQLYPGDYHVAAMRTVEILEFLRGFGFTNMRHAPEPIAPYNTYLIAEKGILPMTREDLMRKELFGINKPCIGVGNNDIRGNQS